MVSGKWKLIENFEDGDLELYDLERDVSEQTNLVSVHPDRVEALHRRLRAWREDVEAIIPVPNPDWPAERKVPAIPNNAHE